LRTWRRARAASPRAAAAATRTPRAASGCRCATLRSHTRCVTPHTHAHTRARTHAHGIRCRGTPAGAHSRRAIRAHTRAQVCVGERDAAGASRYAAVACGDGSVALLLLDAPSPPAKQARTSWALGRGAGGHTACASHVAFPSFAAGPPLLLSAANDGRALLWRWGAYAAGEAAAPEVVAAAAHGAKVNWAATSGGGAGGDAGGDAAPARVLIADTSPTLTAYDVRAG
jgi:hypothetical protein